MSGPERTVMFQLPTVVSGHLVCVEGTVAGRSWDLSAGTFIIGRKEGCDLHLAAEPGVSKVHCKIVAEGNTYRLSDAESRNGTILNGMPTQSAVLNDGDLIQVCGCKLRFTQTSDGNAQVRNPPPTANPEVTDPVQMSPGYDPLPAASAPDLDATLADQAPPASMDLSMDLSVAAAPAPASVEVRGSTLWSFFTGLFAMLICGGGAYAALLYANDGQLPPPDGMVDAPGDPADPAGDGDKVAPPGDGDSTDPAAGDGDPVGPAAGDGDTTDPAAGDGDTDPAAGDGDNADPAAGDGDQTDPAAGDGDTVADTPDAEPEQVASTKKPDPPTGRRRARRPRKKPPVTKDPEPAPATEPEPEAVTDPEPAAPADPAPAAPQSEWFKVTYVPPPKKPVRVPAGGRVKSVEVDNGAIVSRGQTLASVESASSSPAEIATKRESIRALKSIVEGSGDPQAQQLLTEEEAALNRMLASSKSSRLTAPIAGKLEGFRVKAGETLRSRGVVGFVRSQAEPVLEVTVSKAVASQLKAGAAVSLKMPGGTEEGTIKGKPQKRGKKFKVTIVAGGIELSDVKEVQLP